MVEIVIGNQVDRLWGRDFYCSDGFQALVSDSFWPLARTPFFLTLCLQPPNNYTAGKH